MREGLAFFVAYPLPARCQHFRIIMFILQRAIKSFITVITLSKYSRAKAFVYTLGSTLEDVEWPTPGVDDS